MLNGFGFFFLAATTYDICKVFGEINALRDYIKIVTLLQPPPETFALFDELILLSNGKVIYSGPVEQVVPYFESLGYTLPDRMDAADWLQVRFKDTRNFVIKYCANQTKVVSLSFVVTGTADKRWSRFHRKRR